MIEDILVSVIVVSWNTRNVLRLCLQSVRKNLCGLHFNCIVIDNASRDGSSQLVREEFPDMRLVENTQNVGFAAANNQGMKLCNSKYYLLLNPDTILLDGVVSSVVEFADARPHVAVVGCQVLEADQRIQQTGFSFPTPWNLFLIHSGLSRLFPRSRLFGRPQIGWWDRTTEREVEVVSGMFMLVRKAAADQVGLMDPDYFVYAEEADWCFRFWRAGWKCVFAPVGQIIHLDGGGKSTSQVSARMFVQLQKSVMLFQRKNLGRTAWLAAKAIYSVSNAVRALAWGGLGLLRGDATLRRRASAAAMALRFHLVGAEPS
jgi:GT2 family glycosyltransferase